MKLKYFTSYGIVSMSQIICTPQLWLTKQSHFNSSRIDQLLTTDDLWRIQDLKTGSQIRGLRTNPIRIRRRKC